MKLYHVYKNIIEKVKPVELVWFTTFNLDPELVEKYLLSVLGDKEPGDLRTAEDWEVLNSELEKTKIKVWYDYRALNYKSNKRTLVDFIPVDPKVLYNVNQTEAVFHPKVIFIKRKESAYLISGSANLSIAAWSSNCESVRAKEIDDPYNANLILDFFEKLGEDVSGLRGWAKKLKNDKPRWKFVHSIQDNWCLMDHLKGTDEKLTVWSPYFSKKTTSLVDKVRGYGFKEINLVPDISENGSVRISPEELLKLQTHGSANIYRKKDADERLYHAKVWMTTKVLAVGSWNFSYRATGISISNTERNIEAGIIDRISISEMNELMSGLMPGDDGMKGTEIGELEKDWEDVLLPFTYSCIISVDWQDFTYHLVQGEINEKYNVMLPHSTDQRFPLSKIDGLTFKEQHVRLMVDKSFIVYDDKGTEIYQGYLIEENKEKRPVYGYLSLADLFESLSHNPLADTPRKCLKGRHDSGEESEIGLKPLLEYSGTESYYLMFVSFQKLFDSIVEAEKANKNRLELLDRIGFRLPGSLMNICGLVNESINKVLIDEDQNSMVFHWFLVQELKRCLASFRKSTGLEAGHVNEKDLEKKLGFRKKDKVFIRKLRGQFYNVRA